MSYLPRRGVVERVVEDGEGDGGGDGKEGEGLKIVDLTCGGGGHSEAILMHYVKQGRDEGGDEEGDEEGDEGEKEEAYARRQSVTVYGVDQDEESGEQTKGRLGRFIEGVEGVKFKGIKKNFGDLNLGDFEGEGRLRETTKFGTTNSIPTN